MTAFTQAQATDILRALGFRIRTTAEYRQAVEVFQGGYRLGPELGNDRVDGIVGPHTTAALARSEATRRAGGSTASAHFSYGEFTCKCGGKHDGCRRIVVLGALIDALEALRAKHYPGGLVVTSGYRCVAHNTSVGGAARSQHLYGAAADVAQVAKTSQVKALGRFSGIGYKGSTGKVQHVDVRHVSPANTTGSTTASPALWQYS